MTSMKTPPQRLGLSFKVGATLEARDRHNNWYLATIEQIDYDRERVCVHFTQWSRRHNQWINWDSPNIRPADRVSVRRRRREPQQMFVSGSKVLACWTDCRFYPAKILRVNKDGSYKVRFYDGVVVTVKQMKIKAFQEAPAEDDEAMMEMRVESSPSNSQTFTTDNVLLERQIHLPTTHKFSREPLYRVIKNQPPPILSIELDHNPFKCPDPGCTKSFRKSSLLHYHIKYYHCEPEPGREPEPGPGEPVMAKSGPANLRSGDQTVSRPPLDPAQKRKKDRMSLRVKVKKRKKKKKKKRRRNQSQTEFSSDEETSDCLTLAEKIHNTQAPDEGSDWSTLTAESGGDTPAWSAALETDDCELVRCVCEVSEEKDFMIQCESCLCWQHGDCFGLCEENVPRRFICHHCTGWRRTQHVPSDSDWHWPGHMFGLSCVKENYWMTNEARIRQASNLMAHVHVLNQVLRGLQLRMALLHSHPDLHQLLWRPEESSSYISSDHSYTQTHNHLLHSVMDTQEEIHNRLELLETQLDALESWLDQSELETVAPLSHPPQLKQRIRRLLGDLCVLRKLSVCG